MRSIKSAKMLSSRYYTSTPLLPNVEFYTNKIPSKPDNVYLDFIHKKWFGDYQKLEVSHGYIQWLFPISEGGGVNPMASPLLPDERKIFQQPEFQERVLKSYDLMLDFYGLKRDHDQIVKKTDWLIHFDNIEMNPHNLLRITRILKCLKEIGLVEHKNTFYKFLENQVLKTKDLDFCRDSCERFWNQI